jgi:hypothetical protein
MVDLLRLAGMVVLVLAVVAAAALLKPEWACDLGVDGCTLDTQGDDRSSTTLEPDADDLAVQRRILEKERVAQELVDGRLTLFEAATIFRRLNAAPPRSTAPLALYHPGDSEEERLCRHVIAWVRTRMVRRSPYLADVLASRLEEELSRHKARHGAVILPDVDTP